MEGSQFSQIPASVDAHAHVFRRDLPMKPDRRHSPDFNALLPEYLTLLAQSGVQRGVLVQPSFLGTDNSYMLQALEAYPHQLRGVAVIDAAFDDAQLDRLAAAGVVGIRLNLVGTSLPPLEKGQWQSLLKKIAARGWHVEIHRPAADLPLLMPAVLDAGCQVVVDHFGRPDPEKNEDDPGFGYLLDQADSGRVWVKLSAPYRTWEPGLQSAGPHAARLARLLLQAFGAHRLVWGSDWPHTQHQHLADLFRSRQWLEEWVPDALQRERILVSSPAALFGF